jgi:hypothetical protein
MKWRNANRDKFNAYKTAWQQTQLERLESHDYDAWVKRLRRISTKLFQ